MKCRKTFSIFGDSLSTLEGSCPSDNSIFYRGGLRKSTGVQTPLDTWWGQVIEAFGGRLLCNESYSGCTVARPACSEYRYPAACSDERLQRLLDAGEPDVLLILLGLNDWNWQIDYVQLDPNTPWDTCFFQAYTYILTKLRTAFSHTQIWCLTLPASNKLAQIYPPEYMDSLVWYNRLIVEAANHCGVFVADVASLADGYESWDDAHASKAGMKTLANAVLRCMCEQQPTEQ